MNDPDFLGRGWQFPLVTQAGRVLLAADEDDIKQAIRIILQTAKGERLMLPDFGSDLYTLVFADTTHSTLNLAELYIKQALDRWEPRIEVKAIQASFDPQNPNILLINITYVIKSKNAPGNLVYPFYLA